MNGRIVINTVSNHKSLSPEGLIDRIVRVNNSSKKLIFIVTESIVEKIKFSNDCNIVIIPNKDIERIENQYDNEKEYSKDIASTSNKFFYTIYEKVLTEMLSEQDILVLYTIYQNEALAEVAQKYEIKLRYIEQSAIRENAYFEETLMWFMENPNPKSRGEGKTRWDEFDIRNCKLRKPFTADELLLLCCKCHRCIDIQKFIMTKKEGKKIGIVCSVDYPECCGNWNNKKLVEKCVEKYGSDNLLVRMHPIVPMDCINSVMLDDSKDSFSFINKCDTIISAGSNVSFEAMLFEKKVIETGDFSYSDMIIRGFDTDDRCLYDEWYLNFMFFCMYVPLELLCDYEYIDWRLNDNPKEEDIFNRNLDFILNKYYHDVAKNLYEKEEKMEMILHQKGTSMNALIDTRNNWMSGILNVSESKDRDIYICGTGIDSGFILSILKKMGVNVKGFIVTDTRKINIHLEYQVYGIDDPLFQNNSNIVVVLSQRSMSARINATKNLFKHGVVNIF